MTELSREIDARTFERMANAKIMGWQVAMEAQSIADFIRDLEFVRYDTYVSKHFDSCIERFLRGWQINNAEYEGLSINTTFGLHIIQINSMTLANVIDDIKDKWFPRIEFARENDLFN